MAFCAAMATMAAMSSELPRNQDVFMSVSVVAETTVLTVMPRGPRRWARGSVRASMTPFVMV